MKTIYIDSEFKCHVSPADNMTAIETDFFDGKCDTFIEGYRFVPSGQTWTRKDGVTFEGEMIAPWKDYQFLETAQKLYEEMKASAIKEDRILALEEANSALQEENAMLTECVLELSEIVYA